MSLLTLHTPKPGQALKQAPETRPAALAEWLDQLSGKPGEEAAQRLVAELGRLNRSELDEDLRARLTLLHETAVQRLIEQLVASLPENGTPQSVVHRQAANLACELAIELAHAWKLVSLALQHRRSLFGGTKARQTALTHLLAALSNQICTSYRSYTSPPLHGWHELHQLHAAIGEEGWGDVVADDAGHSAETLYRRALLLALADPYRFTRPEIEVTLACLSKFGQLAELRRGGQDRKAAFLINPGSDSPAVNEDTEDASAGLALDTQALCKHLRSLLARLRNGEDFRSLGLTEMAHRINGPHLLARLHQAWRGGNRRGFKRYAPGLTHVEVISGISAIHRLFDPKHKPVPSPQATAGPPADQGEPARWQVANDSANGLAISAHAQEVAQVRMGNPLALREENTADAAWLLGVIRWGKMSKGQVVVAGVEKLSPNAASVVLRFAEGSAANLGQPALLIPANAVLQTEERLLLPQGHYQRGRTADLWHQGERRRIALGGLVEQTPFFDLVEVEPA